MKKVPHLRECPDAGQGNHTWVYYAACTLVEADFSDADAAPIIEAKMQRPPQPTEIQDALNAARRVEKAPTMRWSARDFELINKIADSEPEWSPECPNAQTLPTLNLIFPGNPLLCVGQTQKSFTTGLLGDLKFLHSMSFIVPNPMIALKGTTQAGYESLHSLANTGPKVYQVVEFDWGSINRQLQILRHLANNCAPMRLAMVVFSGSKSAHGWFDCLGVPEATVKNFFDYAVRCGADPRLWLKSQFVRMPAGTRDNGAAQTVLYLDQEYLATRARSFVSGSV